MHYQTQFIIRLLQIVLPVLEVAILYVAAYADLIEPCYIQIVYLLYKYLLSSQKLMSPQLAKKFPAFVETHKSIAVFTRPHTVPIQVLSLTNLVHILFKTHSSIFPLTPRYSSILICILLFIHSRKLHFNQSWNLGCLPIFVVVQFSSLYATFIRIWSFTVSTKRQILYLASSSIRLLRFMGYMIYVPPINMLFPISPAVLF